MDAKRLLNDTISITTTDTPLTTTSNLFTLGTSSTIKAPRLVI